MIELMSDGHGHLSWIKHMMNYIWNVSHPRPIEIYSQDIILYANWLLRQQAYKKNLVYALGYSFSNVRHHLYNEMHTADCWWESQVCQLTEELRKLF
jgi:hypothetical protein